MSTFLYQTHSTEVPVTDTEAVKELLEEYHPTVDVHLEDGTIAIHSNGDIHAPFDVYDSPDQGEIVTREFLEELAAFIEDGEVLEVKCVQTSGRGEPTAYKWTVAPHTVREIRL